MSQIPREQFLTEIRSGNPGLPAEGDIIDLSQVLAFIRHHWPTILLTTLVALLVATALFALLPSRWQASATLEIGQMPVGSSVTLIEPPAQAAERIKQRDNMNSALSRLSIPIDDPANSQAALFRRTLKPAIVKNTNFIRIGIAGYSTQEAHDSLAAAAQTLIDAHNKLMAPILQRVQLRRAENDRQMAIVLSELVALKESLRNAGKPASRDSFAPHIVAVTELSDKEAQVSRIRSEREALEDTVNPSRTFPTRIIDAVYVEPRPYFPKLSLFLAVAAFFGLIAGMGVAWYRERRKNAALAIS